MDARIAAKKQLRKELTALARQISASKIDEESCKVTEKVSYLVASFLITGNEITNFYGSMILVPHKSNQSILEIPVLDVRIIRKVRIFEKVDLKKFLKVLGAKKRLVTRCEQNISLCEYNWRNRYISTNKKFITIK